MRVLPYVRRNFPRKNFERDIAISPLRVKEWSPAIMNNVCRGGMCFEFDSPMQRGEMVVVRIADQSAGNWKSKDGKCICGMVAWCAKLKGRGGLAYEVGLQFKTKPSAREHKETSVAFSTDLPN